MLRSILFTVLCSTVLSAQNKTAHYPTYTEVLEKFYSGYTQSSAILVGTIKFEKRPTGWHVSQISHLKANPETVANELFWSQSKGTYQTLKSFSSVNGSGNQNEIDDKLKDYSSRFFTLFPYYGYPDWELDAIKELEKREVLNDSGYYALARAYSSYAGNLLNNNSGLASSKSAFNPPPGKNSLTEEQLALYRKYQHQATVYFKKVFEINPGFNTIVGPIQTKADNNYLVSFLDILLYQNEEEAKKELADSLYRPAVLGQAKNLLSSCKPNAILFTHGDNDTYPLLYLQAQYGFRVDVMVINVSLANTHRYINRLRDGVFEAPALPLSISAEEYRDDKRRVIYTSDNDELTLEAKKAIEAIKDESIGFSYGDMNLLRLPTKRFSITAETGVVNWELERKILTRADLAIFDMLVTNNWQRPIYFSITMNSSGFLGLKQYLQLRGMVYEVTQTKTEYEGYDYGGVDTKATYQFLVNEYDWSGINNLAPQEKLMCFNYQVAFHRLADALIEKGKSDSALAALDKCFELFPNEKVHYNYFAIQLMEDYYRLDEFDKGNIIARQLVKNIKSGTEIFTNMTPEEIKTRQDQYLSYMKEIATKYNQAEIVELTKQ